MHSASHAEIRCQQRGIPPLVIDLLLRFGCHAHDHDGAEVVFFDQRARRQVKRYAGGLIGKLSQHFDSYAVIADGRIVTAGTRYKRVNRE